jgi:hypothetical protein
MADPLSSPSVESSNDQLRRFEADLKEIVPVDLYECNQRASALKTDLASGNPYNRATRHTEDFYWSFHAIYRHLRRYLPPDIDKRVFDWMENPDMDNPESQNAGINLFYEVFDEMSRQGIGELFETPITPPIGSILGNLSDLDLDLGPESLTIAEELNEEFISPGDIGNLVGGMENV